MKAQDYSTTIIVDATPEQAFNCINNVAGWWTENIEGSSQEKGEEFTVRFGDVHVSTQNLVESIPGKKVQWLVTYSRLNFIEDMAEWTGTSICFDISEVDQKTEIRFTHVGLVPEIECYDACSNAWAPYIEQSLQKLISTGKGQPTKREAILA